MILRRIAEALRSQDWFTVFIEFVIVVAGIFGGLQVSNWNEDRLERKEERASLERLLAEAENAVAYIGREIESAKERIDSQRALLEIMFSDGPIPEDTVDAEWGFTTLNIFPALAPVRTTYAELTATGGIRLIRSSSVRDMISLYYADLDFYLAQQSYFRDSSLTAGNDPSLAAREYVKAEYDPDREVGRRYVIDWSGLRADPYLATMFVDKLRNQIVMNNNRQRLHDGAWRMCDAIATELGTDCVPMLSIESE